jgi:hypothetical protein
MILQVVLQSNIVWMNPKNILPFNNLIPLKHDVMKKKAPKKLSLTKMKIAALNNTHQQMLKGGRVTTLYTTCKTFEGCGFTIALTCVEA